jgi:hypothetical protein
MESNDSREQGRTEQSTVPGQPSPQGYAYEFGTWRLVPGGEAARRTFSAGRPKRRGGG